MWSPGLLDKPPTLKPSVDLVTGTIASELKTSDSGGALTFVTKESPAAEGARQQVTYLATVLQMQQKSIKKQLQEWQAMSKSLDAALARTEVWATTLIQSPSEMELKLPAISLRDAAPTVEGEQGTGASAGTQSLPARSTSTRRSASTGFGVTFVSAGQVVGGEEPASPSNHSIKDLQLRAAGVEQAGSGHLQMAKLAVSASRRSTLLLDAPGPGNTHSDERLSRITGGSAQSLNPSPAEVGAQSVASTDFLGPGVDDLQREHYAKLVARLQERLRLQSLSSNVSPSMLHKALEQLGLTSLSLDNLTTMLLHIEEYYASEESRPGSMKHKRTIGKSGGRSATMSWARKVALVPLAGWGRSDDDTDEIHIPFKHFARMLVMNESSKFKDGTREMILTCREVLVSTDANRLVAEFTQVHADELAAPEQTDRLARWLEPVMCLVIVLNSFSIGYQANYNIAAHESQEWFVIDVFFTLAFLAELLINLGYRGWKWFIYGHDAHWNYFDSVLIFLALTDHVVTLISQSPIGTMTLSLVRVVRLVRLSRLVRVFRLQVLRELAFMIKGLTAGSKTLGLAMILLFCCVYIIGVFANLTLARSVPADLDVDYFGNVPLAMFTVFRCLVGECSDGAGRSLLAMYSTDFGVPFNIAYVASVIFIVFGVFNLIFAIYVEATMTAAKSHKMGNRQEEVKVARSARELFKKFAVAQTVMNSKSAQDREAYGRTREFKQMLRQSYLAADVDSANIQISKDVFLLTLHDKEVQHLLDALDIGSDRANLYDIFDADSSGTVEASELIQGFLSVRGEAKKTDVVANLLAVKATQCMLRKVEGEQESLRMLMNNVADMVAASNHGGAKTSGAGDSSHSHEGSGWAP